MSWEHERLFGLGDVVTGTTPSTSVSDHYGDDIPFVTPVDLDKPEPIESASRMLSVLGASKSRVLPPGTVMVCCIGATIGKVGIAGRDLCTNQQINSIVFDSRKVLPRYGYYACRRLKPILRSISPSTTLPIVSKSKFMNLTIPVPPIAEQHRIAEILDRTVRLLSKRRRALEALDGLERSIFLDMFGEAHDRWPLVTVESVAAEGNNSIRTGPFGSQLLHEEFVDSGIAVLGIDNVVTNEFRWNGRRYITEQKYKQLARYTVHPGDVLITIMGTCGRCAIVPNGIPTAINTKHLCCITLDQDRCLPEFLHNLFLMHPDVRAYLHRTAKGAIMSGLNMRIIKALPVRLPPIGVQRSYSAKLQVLNSQKAKQLRHLAELDSLFLALQHRAFCGEL
jgi:type I restriction enzyme S subunit